MEPTRPSLPADTPPPRTVLIAGVGIVGLVTAIALRALPAPPTVTLHERRRKEEALSGPGGIMVQQNGLAALASLAGSGDAGVSLVAAIAAVAHPLGRGGFQSASGKDLYIAEPASVAQNADMGFSVSRTALMGVLADAAGMGAPGGVEVVWESSVTGFDVVPGGGVVGEDAVDVHVETEGAAATVRGVDVLIGADGIRSGVRAAVDEVTGRPGTPTNYGGLMWWRGSVSYAAVAARCPEVGRLAFAQAWLGRGASMGYFRLGGDDLAWYASAPRPVDAPVARGTPLAEFLAEFDRPSTPPVYAAIVGALASAGGEGIHRAPVFSRGTPVAAAGAGRGGGVAPWGVGPVTLVGDAAHAIFPSLGQGACIGMEDAAEVVAALVAAWRSPPPAGGGRAGGVPAALRAFEAARTPRVGRVGAESERVYSLSALTGWPGVWLRDSLYSLLPPWVVDRQFSWLFSYKPTAVGA